MDMILAKILAVVLALSQVATRPDDVKTRFETSDRAEVTALLRAGCGHVRKTFELEDLQLDDLVETAMMDPGAFAGDHKAFKGIDFSTLHTAYRQFCKNEAVPNEIDVGPVMEFFNHATENLPDHARLKDLRLPDATTVVDAKGNPLSELFEPNGRRIWVSLDAIPDSVKQAFVAAEDKRFFQHKGIDERGLVRAFVANMMKAGRPQGGSTITQQVVKNLLVGDDVTYERKIREIILATRVEHDLTKQQILELYLNTIFLGRNSFGVEMAARSWFGKPVKDLDRSEAALLAGLTKGPNYFNPDRAPDRARDRYVYVLERLAEDKVISADEQKQLGSGFPKLATYDRNESGYFLDYLGREAKATGALASLGRGGSVLRSTIDPALQHAAETALQDGLAQYEMSTGRVSFQGPEANLTEAIRALPADAPTPGEPAWQRALARARLPLADVHWDAAVVIEKPTQKGGALKVGLRDGRVLPLRASAEIARKLSLNDVVLVRVRQDTTRKEVVRRQNGVPVVQQVTQTSARADLRVRPLVQGAAIVLDNKTGRILAMAGGFSYGLSQLNRTAQTRRQPGSSIKPFTYLAALQAGLQPNTLIRDEPVTLPPINGSTRDQDYWTPKTYGGGSSGVTTLRRALENSKNLATVGLLDGGISSTPQQSLDRVCELMVEAQLYTDCQRYYPVVLGAQPVRLIDLAAFYAAIANEGARPTPHAIERIEQDGRVVRRDDDKPLTWLGGADRVSFYQLKTMLQGVVARGTAAAMSRYSPYVAGKTGTSDEENDAWFAGFTNDVTIAVWVGYDNATARRTLGGGETGGKVAVPIFEQIVKAVWASGTPQVALAPPSPDAKRQLASLPIDLNSGDRIGPESGRGAFYEQFRVDGRGKLDDTQYRVVSPDEAGSLRDQQGLGGDPNYDRSYGVYGGYGSYGRGYNGPQVRGLFGQPVESFSPFRGLFGQPQPSRPYAPPMYGDQRTYGDRRYYGEQPPEEPQRQRRIDPDYFWKNDRNFN